MTEDIQSNQQINEAAINQLNQLSQQWIPIPPSVWLLNSVFDWFSRQNGINPEFKSNLAEWNPKENYEIEVWMINEDCNWNSRISLNDLANVWFIKLMSD